MRSSLAVKAFSVDLAASSLLPAFVKTKEVENRHEFRRDNTAKFGASSSI
jgi:hypothetical protein